MTVVKLARSGIATIIAAVAIVVVLVVGVAAYIVYSNSIDTTKLTSVSSSISSSSAAPAPLISFSADAYSIEATNLLNSFAQSTGVPVAPVKSGGSFADAIKIAAGAPDDVFISVALSATGPRYLKNLSFTPTPPCRCRREVQSFHRVVPLRSPTLHPIGMSSLRLSPQEMSRLESQTQSPILLVSAAGSPSKLAGFSTRMVIRTRISLLL